MKLSCCGILLRTTLTVAAMLPMTSPSLAEPLTPQAVSEVAEYLIGVMDTSQQAAANPDFVSVQITTCAIAPPNPEPDSIYLYQEQALSSDLTAPYRQRFLQLTLSADQQRVESHNFKPQEPEHWIGLCDQPNPVLTTQADLGTPICPIALRPSSLGYVGSTPAGGCPVTLRGATRLTNVVVLHTDGMDTWDRGFDDSGTQLWGAQREPYRYRWVAAD
ncbi:MAG: chorismate mutase [Cyanothece sp. SIO1E1]|nr:chorismate mutase [Cyanothece sp. SIO1E1]